MIIDRHLISMCRQLQVVCGQLLAGRVGRCRARGADSHDSWAARQTCSLVPVYRVCHAERPRNLINQCIP